MRTDRMPSRTKPPEESRTERALTDDTPASPAWRRSTSCGPNHTCVEVALLGHRTVGVRDSVPLLPDGSETAPALRLSPAEWLAFTDEVKSGRT